MIKNKIFKICLISVILIISLFLFFKLFLNEKNETKTKTENVVKTEEPKAISCTRTTRLENKPAYDRALSLIKEKYQVWDDRYLKGNDSISYFPSQLVNCIKVEESNLKGTTGEEGNFVFNGEQIKENYFPITVDQNYNYNDETVNALLLVHEITHVQQYLDSINNEKNISCLDMEVDAFMSQLEFYSNQYEESRKSIDLRMENDDELTPQLQIIKDIKSQLQIKFEERRQECLYGSGKNDVGKCVSIFDKKIIKELLIKSDVYKKQCNL